MGIGINRWVLGSVGTGIGGYWYIGGINRYRDLWVLGPMGLLGTGTGVPWDLQVLGSVVPGPVCPESSGYWGQWVPELVCPGTKWVPGSVGTGISG